MVKNKIKLNIYLLHFHSLTHPSSPDDAKTVPVIFHATRHTVQ